MQSWVIKYGAINGSQLEKAMLFQRGNLCLLAAHGCWHLVGAPSIPRLRFWEKSFHGGGQMKRGDLCNWVFADYTL